MYLRMYVVDNDMIESMTGHMTSLLNEATSPGRGRFK